MRKRFLKTISVSMCGMLVVPMLAVTPVSADVAATTAPTAPPVTVTATPTPIAATPLPTMVPVVTELPTSSPAAVESGAITIPEGTTWKLAIPDDKFREFLNETYFDKKLKDDDKLTVEMVRKLQNVRGKFDVSGKGIANLKGLEYFTGITELDASYNNLQFLDISKMPQLKIVNVAYNDLTKLDFGNDNALTELNCRNNDLTILTLSGMTSLETLDCSNNQLNMLNVAGLYQLVTMNCSNNALPTLALDGLSALEKLYCEGNALLTLNVANLKKLTLLENRRSEVTLKVAAVGSDCGVVLPTGAETPSNISNSGTYNTANRAIVWDKITNVPASFTYTYVIPEKLQNVTVTVHVDKTDFVEKAVSLGKVESLKTASTAYNKIKLTWTGVDGATGYRIYRSTSKTSGFKKIKSITSNSKVTYTNSGVACGTTYYYKVRAYRLIDGNYYFGAYSPVIEGKSKPAAPGALTVAKYSRTKVKLSWNKVDGATGYRIYRSKSSNSGFSKIKTITSGATLTYTKKTTRNVKYYYKIRAYKTINGQKVWGKYSKVKSKVLK